MVSRIRAPLALTLTALLAGTSGAAAQRDVRVTATGSVSDMSTGTPLVGALIEFPKLRRQTVTDTTGRFTVYNLPTGKHQMVVSQLGYRTHSRTAEIRTDEHLAVMLEPDPVALKGLEIQVDRLSTRRRSVGVAVQEFERSLLLNRVDLNAAEFIRNRLLFVPCGNVRQRNCIMRRGTLTPTIVYIDERRAIGGLAELESYLTADIYLIEAYDQGRMIRVYTSWFMQNLARGNRTLEQVIIW